jgi:RNA polymerase sigma factor (sigma-70 family)
MSPAAVSPGQCHAWSHTHVPATQTADDEASLMRRVMAQDRQAFETLYARYAPPLARFLARRLHPPDLVDDVLNEVMLALWQHAARCHPDTRPLAWLTGIARHKASTVRRQAARQAAALAAMPLVWDDREDHETRLTRQERQRAVTRAVASLPPAQRLVVEWAYDQGVAVQEMAVRLGESMNTIKSRLRLARYRLARQLAEQGLAPLPLDPEGPPAARSRHRGDPDHTCDPFVRHKRSTRRQHCSV